MPFLLKACPKCRGDLSLEKDAYGSYLSCVQCGLCKDTKQSQMHPLVEVMHQRLPQRATVHLKVDRQESLFSEKIGKGRFRYEPRIKQQSLSA